MSGIGRNLARAFWAVDRALELYSGTLMRTVV
jgi:hypothetical protein